jgi:hypothetical protein
LEYALASNPSHSQAEMVTLRDHLETRLQALELATTVASTSMDKRLDAMNEFRDTLKDQATRFATVQDVDLKLNRTADVLAARMAVLERAERELATFRDQMQGKANAGTVYLAWILSAIGIILSVASLLIG